VKIAFFSSDKPRERQLAAAFARGAQRFKHKVYILRVGDTGYDKDFDLACMVGVKSRILWQQMRVLGIPTMMFDKGYSRQKVGGGWLYWRIAYDSHQPTPHTLNRPYSDDRFKRLKLPVCPWREKGKHILIAGSSEKYQQFYGLPNPTEYAKGLVRKLRQDTSRPIIYRPKPSWRAAVPVAGTEFSKSRSLLADLENCHAVVTHGSNVCYEAALYGIPSVITGQAVMKSVSSTELSDIEHPLMGERWGVFRALAYHQWTLKEMARGTMFNTVKDWL